MRQAMGSIGFPVDRVVPFDSGVMRAGLRKHIQRTVISVDGVVHRLRLVAVEPGPSRKSRSILITVTTDNTSARAQVHLSRERLEYPDFVASLLAHAMRGVLTGELPPDGIEAL